jgi:hypothetical protein
MLAVSSDECVRALLLAGFRVCPRVPGRTILEYGYRRIEVPDGLILSPEVLDAVLRAAHVSRTEFVDLVSRAFPSEGSAVNATGVRRARLARETG